MIKRTIIILLLILAALAAARFAAPFIFTGMADFLMVGDRLGKSDAILVLAGDSNGERVTQAVALYKSGWAPVILMSGGPAVWNMTYAQNMRNQARFLGVPDKDIIVQDRSESTFEDLKLSLPILKLIKAKKLIIVSSPYHMRRAVMIARKMYRPEGIEVLACPVQRSRWNPREWWTRHEDTQAVVWEYMALAQYSLKGWLF